MSIELAALFSDNDVIFLLETVAPRLVSRFDILKDDPTSIEGMLEQETDKLFERIMPMGEGMIARITPRFLFEVLLRDVGMFPGDPGYLWLKPEDGGMLRRIRDVLAAQFPQYVSVAAFGGSFVPHVTVSVFDSAQALAEAQKRVTDGLAPVHFWVTEFTYGAFDQDGGVVHIDRLPLGKGNAVPGYGPA